MQNCICPANLCTGVAIEDTDIHLSAGDPVLYLPAQATVETQVYPWIFVPQKAVEFSRQGSRSGYHSDVNCSNRSVMLPTYFTGQSFTVG